MSVGSVRLFRAIRLARVLYRRVISESFGRYFTEKSL